MTPLTVFISHPHRVRERRRLGYEADVIYTSGGMLHLEGPEPQSSRGLTDPPEQELSKVLDVTNLHMSLPPIAIYS